MSTKRNLSVPAKGHSERTGQPRHAASPIRARREPNGIGIIYDSEQGLFRLPRPISFSWLIYRGCGVCATITPFLKSSTISGFRRTSVGRFAKVIWSI